MGLFAKREKQTIELDYRFEEVDELPAIQAYGMAFGKFVYCNAYYAIKTAAYDMWDNGRYACLARDLNAWAGRKKIEVTFKLKNGEPYDFTIDLERLGTVIGNPDAANLELLGWGIVDKPEL